METSIIYTNQQLCVLIFFVLYIGFASAKPTNQSPGGTQKNQSGSKSGLLVSLIVLPIVILLIVLLVIFRARLIQFLPGKRCSNDETRKQHEMTAEPASNVARTWTENRELSSESDDHVKADLNYVYVQTKPQYSEESHYMDLNSANKEPENIYQSLEFPTRLRPWSGDERITDDYEIMP